MKTNIAIDVETALSIMYRNGISEPVNIKILCCHGKNLVTIRNGYCIGIFNSIYDAFECVDKFLNHHSNTFISYPEDVFQYYKERFSKAVHNE